MRSTLSATTLSMGASPSPVQQELHELEDCKMSMVDHVLGPNMESIRAEKHTLTCRLAHWIRVRGPSPPPEHVGDYGKDIQNIWDLIQSKTKASEDLDKLNGVYEKLIDQIHTAKMRQLDKWKSITVPKAQSDELNSWVNNKMAAAFETVMKGDQKLAEISKSLEAALLALINKMLNNLHVEEECDELMCELEKMFGDMEIDETPKDSSVAPMDVTQIALGHVHALADGPQKTALLAVLETAMTRPTEVWFQFFP